MAEASLILSVETATRAGSVCLARGGEVLNSAVGDPHSSHSNTLLRDIKLVLEQSGLSLSEIDLFAVASGPGSFTGLRIGLATIKGLATTLQRPCLGIPTLHAVARSAGVAKVSVALLPAGRGEVFAQMLSVLPNGSVEELDAATYASPQEVLNKYRFQQHIRWCGEGAHLHRETIQGQADSAGIDFTLANDPLNETDQVRWTLAPIDNDLARHVAALALERFEQRRLQDPSSLRAIYVRPSDAELKEQCQQLSQP